MSKEILKNEPQVPTLDNDTSYPPKYLISRETEMVDTDAIYQNTVVKQEANSKFGMEVTRRMSPLKEAFEGGGTSPLFLQFMQKNPDIILRKSSFDGMGILLKSEDLDGKTAFLYECEVLNYEANDENGELKPYHYAVWLGRLDETGESFVYSAGKQLTELAEALILPENKAVKDDVSLRGIHVKFNMIKLKSDPKKSFMKVDVIP